MKILMIFQVAPLPPPRDMASAKRNYPFLRENIKHHEVSVISFGTKEEERAFRDQMGSHCKHVRFVQNRRPRILNGLWYLLSLLTARSPFRALVYRRKMQDAIDELLGLDRFDLIHSCGQLFGVYRFPPGVALVSDTHNVEYDIVRRTYQETRPGLRRILLFLDYRLSKKFEIAASREFGVLLATTERDKALLQSDLPGKEIVVIQNGVHESFLGYPPVPRDPHMMVFVGLFTFYPNAHAVRHFLDEIFPGIRRSIPDAKITIVGSHPPRDIVDRASDHVAVTGWVDDVRPYIASAGVFVIPLRIGSGIRGKALEAMAMKCPIVTTTLGCAGIDLQDGVSALFADRPEDFAAAVVRLMQNPAEGQQLAEQAYAVVARKHDWVAKGEELQQVYQRLLERTPCPASTEPGLNPESGS